MVDHVGKQVGNYRLLRLLGQGGFADVYLGEHRYLKNYAALKLVRTTLSDEQGKAFLAEAQILARLAHPQVVRILDFLFEEGTAVVVMEYASGGTLRQSYPHGSRLSLEKTVIYVKYVAQALQYAHNRGIIHRDVKPENMLLGSRQDLLLSDFGISLLASSPELMSTQEMVGTTPYIAPEQLRGRPGFASDQYSLGIVTYEWLCGKRPFEGNQWAVIQQHLSSTPPPLRVPGIPAAVEAVVLRALSKEPQQRFPSVQAFAYAFENAANLGLPAELDEDTQATIPLQKPRPRTAASVVVATPSQRIFLTAAPANNAFATRLRTDMEQRGAQVWYDHIETSDEKEDATRQAIRETLLVVLVLSSHSRSSRIVRERMRIANMYEQPMAFVWAEGKELGEVLPILDDWGKTAVIDVIDARGTAYTQALEKIFARLEHETPLNTGVLDTITEPLHEPRNPYKGLRAFSTDEAIDFFGRDALIDELLESLKVMITAESHGESASRLLEVIGPSGSGKSSAVMAGVLPQLQAGVLPGSEQWIYLKPIVPGQRPLESLALSLSPFLPGRSMKELLGNLQDDSARGLHLLATHLLRGGDDKVVLVIDQFEELFTQTSTEDERQCFLDLLVAAVTEPHGPVIALITLRADFSDRPMHYPELYRLIEAHHKSVLPMAIQDLRAVIEQPAALSDVLVTFEGDLVGDLLFESYGQIGILPLLEFTLDQLFQLRSGHRLTLQAYQQIGGVKGALAKQAEETYTALPSDEHRRLARAVFLRLINPGMTEQVATRRRIVFSELSLPDAKQTAITQQVVDAFIAARLLITNEIAGTTTVEISHEALIRAWVRLSDWLQEAREDIRIQQVISSDAVSWEQRGKTKDRLYRGSQLLEARTWAERNLPNQNEQAFLRSGIVQQRRSRIRVIAVVLLLLLTIGLTFQVVRAQFTPSTVVMNTHDTGDGSLRQVIDHALPGSTITFTAGLQGTITLVSVDLDIKQNLTINGPIDSNIIITSGLHGKRVKIEPSATVTISHISFENSKHLSSGFIYNAGNLTLNDSTVSGNSSGDLDVHEGFGGGLSNFGVLVINRSHIFGNTATRQGGGILNFGMLTLSDTIISNNRTDGDGGGIYTTAYGPLSLINSTVSNNTAIGEGGGIANGGLFNGGTLSLTNSIVSSNKAQSNGGGISNYGVFTVTNSTISDNTAAGNGGGIFNGSTNSTVSLTFSTLYNNSATAKGAVGGALFLDNSAPTTDTQVTACIVVGNHAPVNAGIAGSIASNGYNLLQNMADVVFLTGGHHDTDREVTDADLTKLFATPVQLQKNGGLTETYALQLNSTNPALGDVPLSVCHTNGITTDQRAIKRPDSNEQFCDIGAYELVD